MQSYFYTDDTFNYNFGQALASTSQWKEAEEAFLLVQSEKIKADYCYLSWLARCCELGKTKQMLFVVVVAVWFIVCLLVLLCVSLFICRLFICCLFICLSFVYLLFVYLFCLLFIVYCLFICLLLLLC